MTNNLQTFVSDEFGSIRAFEIDGEPWFVGKDIALALGYAKPQNAIKAHVDDEDKTTAPIQGSGFSIQGTGSGYKTVAIIINESGLYSLILSSKLPNAKKFKRWVTNEVLPAIRKTGAYSIETEQAPITKRETTMDDYLKAASIIASCRNERLPYVFKLLNSAGIDIAVIQPYADKNGDPQHDRDTSGECARLINTAVNDYGMSMRAIGKLVSLETSQIQRIRSGVSTPTILRSQLICDAIRKAIPGIV
jgi:prophage antirepressor-like protein